LNERLIDKKNDNVDDELSVFIINDLKRANNFTLTDDRIIVYSETEIYTGQLNIQDSNTRRVYLD
jgi:hypothetical protein